MKKFTNQSQIYLTETVMINILNITRVAVERITDSVSELKLTKKKNNLTNEFQSLQENFDQLLKQNELVKAERTKLEDHCRKIEIQNSTMIKTIEDLKVENENHIKNTEKIKQELQKVQSEKEKLQKLLQEPQPEQVISNLNPEYGA